MAAKSPTNIHTPRGAPPASLAERPPGGANPTMWPRGSVERLSTGRAPSRSPGTPRPTRRALRRSLSRERLPKRSPRRRVRSLSRRARFPSVEAVCIPDSQDDDEDDREPQPWESFAAYDLARQTIDITIFRQTHDLDSETVSPYSISTDGFWERRTMFEQWLLVLCASVVLMTCVTLTYTFYYSREYSKTERLKQVGIEYYDCQTPVCTAAAIELKDTLNLNKNPCKNFYEYVCSLWPNRYQIPDDMGCYSVQDNVREEVRQRIFAALRKGPMDVDQRFGDEITAMRLIDSCRDLRVRQDDGLAPLTRVMRALSLSEWPYELGERLPRARSVVQRLSVDYGLPFFVSLSVEPDPREPRANLLVVDVPEPLLHSSFVLLRDSDEHRALLRAHASYIRRAMALMGALEMAPTVTTDVHDYEFALAELCNYRTLRELTEFTSDNIVSLDKLLSDTAWGEDANTTPAEPTKELLASIVREIYQRGGVPMRFDEEILIWNVSTFSVLDKFLASENRRMLLNYLGWRVVALLGPKTTPEMMNARHTFYMAKFGAEDQPQLSSFCFEQAARLLPVAVGRMAYRGTGDSGQAQRLVARMVDEIKAALLLLLKRSDVSWLNKESKEVAINKIRRLRLIQQPINSTVMDWEPPELRPEASFGTNIALLLSARAEQNWMRLAQHNYLDSTPVPQLRMSISYDVYRNAIVVPAILTGPGLSSPGILAVDLSPSINFGAFGYLAAHEMLRSIMFSGSVIDAEGNLRNWQFGDTSAKFRILVNCFESMLRRTIPNELMKRVRSSSVALSQMLSRELVIGSTALPAVFKAYRTFMARYEGESEYSSLPRVRFSQNQLFFLYFAKSWCHTRRRVYEAYYIEDTNQPPPDLRVNHILMDFEKFGKTFDCQLGDIMTPHFKCSTW